MKKAQSDLSKIKQSLNFSMFFAILRDSIIGLTSMHLKSIVHLDIKPENIMKFSDNNFIIADYGIGINLTYFETYSRNDCY